MFDGIASSNFSEIATTRTSNWFRFSRDHYTTFQFRYRLKISATFNLQSMQKQQLTYKERREKERIDGKGSDEEARARHFPVTITRLILTLIERFFPFHFIYFHTFDYIIIQKKNACRQISIFCCFSVIFFSLRSFLSVNWIWYYITVSNMY